MLSLLTPGESGDRLRLPFCVAGTAPVVVYRIQVQLHLCPQTVQRTSCETLKERLGEKGGKSIFLFWKNFLCRFLLMLKPTSRLLWEEHKKNCFVLLKTVCHSWELFHWTLLRSWLLAAAKHYQLSFSSLTPYNVPVNRPKPYNKYNSRAAGLFSPSYCITDEN